MRPEHSTSDVINQLQQLIAMKVEYGPQEV